MSDIHENFLDFPSSRMWRIDTEKQILFSIKSYIFSDTAETAWQIPLGETNIKENIIYFMINFCIKRIKEKKKYLDQIIILYFIIISYATYFLNIYYFLA